MLCLWPCKVISNSKSILQGYSSVLLPLCSCLHVFLWIRSRKYKRIGDYFARILSHLSRYTFLLFKHFLVSHFRVYLQSRCLKHSLNSLPFREIFQVFWCESIAPCRLWHVTVSPLPACRGQACCGQTAPSFCSGHHRGGIPCVQGCVGTHMGKCLCWECGMRVSEPQNVFNFIFLVQKYFFKYYFLISDIYQAVEHGFCFLLWIIRCIHWALIKSQAVQWLQQ